MVLNIINNFDNIFLKMLGHIDISHDTLDSFMKCALFTLSKSILYFA